MEIKDNKMSKRNIIIITNAIFLAFAVIFTLISLLINNYSVQNCVSQFYENSIENSFHNSYEDDFYNSNEISEVLESKSSESLSENSNDSEIFTNDISIEESSQEDSEFEHGWIINKYGYTYLYDDCGYVQFNYSEKILNKYADSINYISSLVQDNATVYNITVPVSSTFVSIPREIYKKDNFYNKSQTTFVSTFESKLDKTINIPIVSKLQTAYENGDYLFFRTDNNWTQLGAYYAYTAFCEASGINAYALSNFPKIEVGKYLGRFYLATQSEKMKNNPDYILGYAPLTSIKTDLTVYNNGLVYNDFELCNNTVDINSAYDIFMGMPAGRYEINTTSDGGSLLIIGDSSAYAIIPFLTSHYSKIEMLDPQYYDLSLEEFLTNRTFDDVLIMCYSTNATSGDYIPCLNTIAGVITDNE